MPRMTRRTAALMPSQETKEVPSEVEKPTRRKRATRSRKEDPAEKEGDVTKVEDKKEGEDEDPASAQLILEFLAKVNGKKGQEGRIGGGMGKKQYGENAEKQDEEMKVKEKEQEGERNVDVVENEIELQEKQTTSTPGTNSPTKLSKTPRFDPLIHGVTSDNDDDWSSFEKLCHPRKKTDAVKPKTKVKPDAAAISNTAVAEAKTSSSSKATKNLTKTRDDVNENDATAEEAKESTMMKQMRDSHARTARLAVRPRSEPISAEAKATLAGNDGGGEEGHEIGETGVEKKGIFENPQPIRIRKRIPTSSLPKIPPPSPSSAQVKIPGAFPTVTEPAEKNQLLTANTARTKRPRSPSTPTSPEKRHRPSVDPKSHPLPSTRPRTVGLSFPPPPTPVRSTKPPTKPVTFSLSSDARVRRAAEIREERRRRETEEKERKRRFGRQVPPSAFRTHITLHQETFPKNANESAPGTPNARRSFIPVASPPRAMPIRGNDEDAVSSISVAQRISMSEEGSKKISFPAPAPLTTPSPERECENEKLQKTPTVVFRGAQQSSKPSSSSKNKVAPTVDNAQASEFVFPRTKFPSAPANLLSKETLLAAAAKLPAIASPGMPTENSGGIDEAAAKSRKIASEKGKEAIKAWADAQREKEQR